ncbi:hypothetical protein NKG94_22790 [Micromonospora sp. M12]
MREALDSTGLPGMSAVVTHGDRIVYAGGLGRDSSDGPSPPTLRCGWRR